MAAIFHAARKKNIITLIMWGKFIWNIIELLLLLCIDKRKYFGMKTHISNLMTYPVS